MSGIYIDGISLGENHWAIISKFFRAVVGPTDTTVEGRFVEERGKIWLILNGERHEVTPVPDHGRLGDLDALKEKIEALIEKHLHGYTKSTWDFVCELRSIISGAPAIIPADEEAGE